ncbi:unnamed protein product [Microthlaspi erraticum]|uniref:Uncharacterized protein n=1 Tax=Microthlaspi erraticum TaxID=1685480 RepID=A0A6D2HXR9_9BRAS|nr:unnamed protein product [Microthlaspi erraticum]
MSIYKDLSLPSISLKRKRGKKQKPGQETLEKAVYEEQEREQTEKKLPEKMELDWRSLAGVVLPEES